LRTLRLGEAFGKRGRFRAKTVAFCRENAAYEVENPGKISRNRELLAAISFREMSDFKALAKIFLPTPPSAKSGRRGGGDRKRSPTLLRGGLTLQKFEMGLSILTPLAHHIRYFRGRQDFSVFLISSSRVPASGAPTFPRTWTISP
jgi:hypothetical protein